MANRLYRCPVVYLEPYVANSRLDHARIQAGDYEGLREFDGEMRPSLYREYAGWVTAALLEYYGNGEAVPIP